MSTLQITRSTASGDPGARAQALARHGVAVLYEARAEGAVAMEHACALARQDGVPLTVLSVAHRERTDIGCGSCRQGAMFRNELACEFATAELTEARNLVQADAPGVTVNFVLARGSFTRAVLTAAAEHGADVIVVPARRRGRLRRAVSRDRAETLSRRTEATVIVAPATAER